MYEISVIKFYVRPVTMKSKVFPAFSSIRIEYREKLRISPHSVRIRENTGKMRTRITPNTDTLCLSVFSPNAGKCGKNADQNNSEYGHFLRSEQVSSRQVFVKSQRWKHLNIVWDLIKLNDPERHYWRHSSVILANFRQILYITLVFPFLTSTMKNSGW